jgi:hypothetical protein
MMLKRAQDCLNELEQACVQENYSGLQGRLQNYHQAVVEAGQVVVAKANTAALSEMTALLEQHERFLQTLYCNYKKQK